MKQFRKQRYKSKQGRNHFNPLGTPKFIQNGGNGKARKGRGKTNGSPANLSLRIQLIMEEYEVVPKTQMEGEVSTTLKELAGNKMWLRQKEAGLSYSVADDPVMGRLLKMEEVDVENRVGRGKGRSDQ